MVAPELIGCIFAKMNCDNSIIWGVIVETEAYSQAEPACHGYKKRTNNNSTLFGEPGKFYIYLTYGTYYCINVVTHKSNWASGVLLRSIALPRENERIASGPGLLTRRFGLNKTHDNLTISVENRLWLAESSYTKQMLKLVNTKRIGISKANHLSWRWYLKSSRSISKRAKGDRCPSIEKAWQPSISDFP